MNLVNDPWIPVVLPNGTDKVVSLRECYEQGDAIRDLAVNPPQRIALMRLLICITQAALDGPEDEADWSACKPRIGPDSIAYLDTWRHCFELYGEKPFLQVAGLEVDEGDMYTTPIDKLDVSLAAGNAHTLFDLSVRTGIPRKHNVSRIPLMLLVCQSFSLCGGQSTAASIAGVQVDGSANGAENNNYTASPCASSKLHTFVRCADVLSTIHANLLTKKMACSMPNSLWGRPTWEHVICSYRGDHVRELHRGLLSHLLPLSRFVLLDEANRRYVRAYTNGYSHANDPRLFREPTCTVVQNDGDELQYACIRPGRHPWRDLSAIMAVRHGGALILDHLSGLDAEVVADIWVGGLLSNQGKPLEAAEWSFDFDLQMLQSSVMESYARGVSKASAAQRKLSSSVATYWHSIGVSQFEMKANGVYAKRDNRSRQFRQNALGKAAAHFWSLLDVEHRTLIDAATDLSTPLDQAWYPVVRDAMKAAYAFACPHTTARQIEAFAQGMKLLKLKKFGDTPQ